MEELQLALTTARVDQRNFGVWIKNWQVGQVLNALVTGQRPSGELVLRVAGQQITATADIPVQQGAKLMMEVTSLDPVPKLRILNPVAPASTAGGAVQLLPLTGSTSTSLPLGSVWQNLQTVAGQPALASALAGAATQVFRAAGRTDRLIQPQGLAQAIRNSGIFLESELLAASTGRETNLEQDAKAGLFRALARVDAALSEVGSSAMNAANVEMMLELKRELEAGLGRITLLQLNSQPVDAQSARGWQFELPVQFGQQFYSLLISLDEEPAGPGQADQESADRWRVTLQLETDALGALKLSLRLVEEQLELRIAAEREEIRALIDAGMPTLERALASHGLGLSTTAAVPLSNALGTASSMHDSDKLSVRA